MSPLCSTSGGRRSRAGPGTKKKENAMKRIFAAAALAVLATAVLAACTTLQSNRGDWEKRTGLDHKLSRFSYIEEGKLVGLAVDLQAARYREDTPFVPIEVAVANRGLSRLTVTRESFWLIDEEGNRYSLATVGEIREGYGQVEMDQRFTNFRSVLLSRWSAYTIMPSSFFSGGGSGTGLVFDQVQLPKFSYFTDWLYFPHPATGVVGHRFELFLDARELDDPIFVKFKID
jgi:hypothetical protein